MRDARAPHLARSIPVLRAAGETPSTDNVSCGIFHSVAIVAAAACQGAAGVPRRRTRCNCACVCARACEQTNNEDRVHTQDPRITASAPWSKEGLSTLALYSLAFSPCCCCHETRSFCPFQRGRISPSGSLRSELPSALRSGASKTGLKSRLHGYPWEVPVCGGFRSQRIDLPHSQSVRVCAMGSRENAQQNQFILTCHSGQTYCPTRWSAINTRLSRPSDSSDNGWRDCGIHHPFVEFIV